MALLPLPSAFRTRARQLARWLLRRERLWLVLLAASLVALGTFLEISAELYADDGELARLDALILGIVKSHRLAWLTISIVDLTALGSLTLIGLATGCALVALVRSSDLLGALQLVAGVVGAGTWTMITKRVVARPRPDMIERLIDVEGYSFPSGHSAGAAALYLSIALVFARYLKTLPSRALLFAVCTPLALAIGLSRIYLGVHYPSDVASGLLFGAGWALLLAAACERVRLHTASADGERDELDRRAL